MANRKSQLYIHDSHYNSTNSSVTMTYPFLPNLPEYYKIDFYIIIKGCLYPEVDPIHKGNYRRGKCCQRFKVISSDASQGNCLEIALHTCIKVSHLSYPANDHEFLDFRACCRLHWNPENYPVWRLSVGRYWHCCTWRVQVVPGCPSNLLSFPLLPPGHRKKTFRFFYTPLW